MDIKTSQDQLAAALRDTPEYREFIRLHDIVYSDGVSAALIKEYESLQTKLQMYALTGKEAAQSDIDRFNQLNGLMALSPQTGAYLLSKVRMHKLLADVFAGLSESCGLPIELPNV